MIITDKETPVERFKKLLTARTDGEWIEINGIIFAKKSFVAAEFDCIDAKMPQKMTDKKGTTVYTTERIQECSIRLSFNDTTARFTTIQSKEHAEVLLDWLYKLLKSHKPKPFWAFWR